MNDKITYAIIVNTIKFKIDKSIYEFMFSVWNMLVNGRYSSPSITPANMKFMLKNINVSLSKFFLPNETNTINAAQTALIAKIKNQFISGKRMKSDVKLPTNADTIFRFMPRGMCENFEVALRRKKFTYVFTIINTSI
jgi:basic membrane lipoprotein Med (substrate-binding protein (PBP1-ABC) superfamily)